jgi:ubiquinone/menaquinone biosynthesis C-methylase UbiE
MGPESFTQQRLSAENYDADRFGGRFGAYLKEQEVALFLGLLEGRPDAVLDAGAGTGKLSLALLEQKWNVTSLDLSWEMIRIARRKAADLGVPGRFAVADLQSLCFKDKAFGCTLSSRVLMHLHDWRAGIAELCRVTKDLLVIDFPPHLSFAGLDALRKRWPPWRGDQPPQAYAAFFLADVVEELKRGGFTVAEVVRSYFFPVRLHRWLDRPSLSRRLERLPATLGLTGLIGAPVTVKAFRTQA